MININKNDVAAGCRAAFLASKYEAGVLLRGTAGAFCLITTVAVSLLTPSILAGNPSLGVQSGVIGRNLETSANVTLSDPAPNQGVSITVRSTDPAKLLLSTVPDRAGIESIEVHVRQGYRESPEFWLQASSDAGKVDYTVQASGYDSATGTVTFAPSAIVIIGPFKAPAFQTTTGAIPTGITLKSARLDSSLQFVEEQAIAGGLSVQTKVNSSNTAAGIIPSQPPAIRGGESAQMTTFQPAGEGETRLSVTIPPGFATPAQFADVLMTVRKPGLGLSSRMRLGQNLELPGVLSLGEAAPAQGLEVTITSADPSRLLLSPSATEIGAASVTVKIPGGGVSGQYYVQGTGNAGTVSYAAAAPGFQSRTVDLELTPSGIMLTPIAQGPPDEAQVLRKEAPDGTHRFATSLALPIPVHLVAWTAQLDPETHRGADITVQALRAGVTLNILLSSSQPTIGGVAPSVTIEGGRESGVVEFTPLHAGTTEISVATPEHFTTPANSTMVIAVVNE